MLPKMQKKANVSVADQPTPTMTPTPPSSPRLQRQTRCPDQYELQQSQLKKRRSFNCWFAPRCCSRFVHRERKLCFSSHFRSTDLQKKNEKQTCHVTQSRNRTRKQLLLRAAGTLHRGICRCRNNISTCSELKKRKHK